MSYDPDDVAVPGRLFGLPFSAEESKVWVYPVPYQATVSYRGGTRGAPAAILEASGQLDLCDLETGEPWREGIWMAPTSPEVVAMDARASKAASAVREGDLEQVEVVDECAETLERVLHDWTASCMAQGRIPGVVGGDHSVPLGAIRAAVEQNPGMGILHIDAHADLRAGYEGFKYSHASILHHVAGLEGIGPIAHVALRDISHAERDRLQSDPNLHAWTDIALGNALAQGTPWYSMAKQIIDVLPEQVWVTFDVDGLDPSLCPGTGTPVPGGLSWREALVLLGTLGRSGRKIVGFDICEVGTGEIDALVGARLLYKLAGWAIHTHAVTGEVAG